MQMKLKYMLSLYGNGYWLNQTFCWKYYPRNTKHWLRDMLTSLTLVDEFCSCRFLAISATYSLCFSLQRFLTFEIWTDSFMFSGDCRKHVIRYVISMYFPLAFSTFLGIVWIKERGFSSYFKMSTTSYAYCNLPLRRKNAKSSNVCYQVLRRSICGTSLRRDLKIIRSLIQKEGSKFMKVWSKDTKHPVGFDSQHLFFDRFRTCYTSHGFERKPELLYQLGACENSKRIESALVFESPVDQDAFLNCIESKGYKPCLLTVSKDGWLTRYDLKTGVVLQNVYLSKQYKFKHVLWESDLHRIVLKSIHFSSVNRPLMYLAVFCMAPLQFQALMPIEKSVFGQDTIDATASNGFLVIMHQANKIRFYSLLEVMEKYCLAARLGKLFATSSSSNCHWDITLPFTSPFIIGEEPNGLPVNVTFTSKPVVLFEIISNQHVISFGGHPWHYIACPPAHSSVFHVRSVKDSTLVKHGILEMDSLSVEPDQAYFHADNSGRILHIGPHVIR